MRKKKGGRPWKNGGGAQGKGGHGSETGQYLCNRLLDGNYRIYE